MAFGERWGSVHGGEQVLVSVNSSDPKSSDRVNSAQGASCRLPEGTARFVPSPTPLPDSPHLQAASRSSSLQRGRPCQRCRRGVTSGSFDGAGQRLSARIRCGSCGARRGGKLSGALHVCPFLT